jgi:hypothetical protein
MDDIESIRKETVFRIGRNLVNIQKVEHLLKSLVIISRIEGNSPDSVKKFIDKRTADMKKKPMGFVVDDFNKSVVATQPYDEIPKCISTVLQIIVPEDLNYREWRKSLKSLVEERNLLVHQLVNRFDHTSQDSCEILSKQLDQQNEKIKNAYEVLKSIFLTYHEAIRGLKEFVDSEVFLQQLQEALNETPNN